MKLGVLEIKQQNIMVIMGMNSLIGIILLIGYM
jgi:hypothetical protein